MSLFGSLMGDLDDDPIFGSHMRSMRQMNNMMNNLFSDPFGMMAQNAITDGGNRGRVHHAEMQMMPFGFPPMPTFNFDRMFTNFDNMAAAGNCHSFTSRSVMTMASGPDGRPQVYQETMSTRTAPGGVKETKQTVSDTRTGTKKMAIGHHIGDRAHILEREQNVHNGDQEERQEFINLDEEEAESFNHEWETRTRRTVGAIGGPGYSGHGHRTRPDHRQLALPEPSGSRHSNTSRWAPTARRGIRTSPTSKAHSSVLGTSSKPAKAKPDDAKPTTSTSTSASPSSQKGSRKRDHIPDAKACKRRHAVPDSDV